MLKKETNIATELLLTEKLIVKCTFSDNSYSSNIYSSHPCLGTYLVEYKGIILVIFFFRSSRY